MKDWFAGFVPWVDFNSIRGIPIAGFDFVVAKNDILINCSIAYEIRAILEKIVRTFVKTKFASNK